MAIQTVTRIEYVYRCSETKTFDKCIGRRVIQYPMDIHNEHLTIELTCEH